MKNNTYKGAYVKAPSGKHPKSHQDFNFDFASMYPSMMGGVRGADEWKKELEQQAFDKEMTEKLDDLGF